MIIRAFALWTVWVWGTRIGNVIGEQHRSWSFKAVHVVLAVISVALAVAAWVITTRARRRGRIGESAR